jgi:hypothetical protein
LASQVENIAGPGDLKDLYLTTKKLVGKFQKTEKPVKDKDDNPLASTEEQLKK